MPSLTTLRLRTIARVLGACGLATFAQAQQFSPIDSPPMRPTDLRPLAGDYEGLIDRGTVLTMGWGQFFPSGPGLFLYPPATHFVICVDAYVGGTAPPCTLANADFVETIAAPTPALIRNGNRFTFMPARFIENSELNSLLRFTVLSCSALFDRNCRATGVDLYFSSRNPASDSASENQTLTTPKAWYLDVRALNTGTGEVGPFTGTVELLEVVSVGNPGRDCLKDVDHNSIAGQTNLVVIGKDGSRTPLQMVQRTNGVYSGPVVVGIFRQGSFSVTKNYATTGKTSFAGKVESSRGIAVLDFAIPSNVTQRTFVAVHALDTGNAIREFNENDNVAAQCRKR